jgi:hypothetical protein
MRAERLISFEDSRVKRVLEVAFACTTLKRNGQSGKWSNGQSERQEGGLTQRTRAPEEGRRRKRGTWMDRRDRMETGRWERSGVARGRMG